MVDEQVSEIKESIQIKTLKFWFMLHLCRSFTSQTFQDFIQLRLRHIAKSLFIQLDRPLVVLLYVQLKCT